METLSSLFPLPLSVAVRPHHSPPKLCLPIPISVPTLFQCTLKGAKIRRKTVVSVGNPSDPRQDESRFMDENGVIEDMDGYLNHLSLEYDSVWDTKPSWCQPWTITLTGISVIASSWLILQSIWVTAFVSLVICTWWYIFLYSYPKAYVEMIAERRKKVLNGVEDTFGLKKSQ
ncbi:hypothetical protein SLEP1_g1085 [Rubroshorea leprosula]|uniref:DUF6737 domain-containing protein n=1 Tax=Rubroshorea leprosula TaxID=152421 RepID=A0AAV5HCN0_9ROSI|nr:hypothetical protein SLEP1_g1085 [Rubroshorea leprosula]